MKVLKFIQHIPLEETCREHLTNQRDYVGIICQLAAIKQFRNLNE